MFLAAITLLRFVSVEVNLEELEEEEGEGGE
jgi:hypothetical protein